MARLLEGKSVAENIKEDIINKISICMSKGITPQIAIIRVGERHDDVSYEKRVLKNCDAVGILAKQVLIPESASTEDVLKEIAVLGEDKNIHGIMLFRPLPKHMDENMIANGIPETKDIDCINPGNLQHVFTGEKGIAPCTPEAAMEILKYYNYSLEGKDVVIVNRSLVLGKPLSMLMLGQNASVTLCHSKTQNIKEKMQNADVVVTGIGKAKYYNDQYFSEKNIVVDVGINFADGKTCGDVDFEKVEAVVSAITPVPGGVGIVTSMILLRHVLLAMELQGAFKW